MRIDPKFFVEFALIAQERSFTTAAARLRVAQPWLSARFAKLEGMLGFRLLDRTTRRVSLTEQGDALLPVAMEMARLAEIANRLALQLDRSERRVLRVGAAPSTKVISHRHELLNDFTFAHSDVSLELESAWSMSLLTKLRSGEIDVSFMMGAVDPEQFDRLVLSHHGVAITVVRSHCWADSPSLSPNDLAGQTIQVFTRSLNPNLWDLLYAPLVEAGCRFVEMPEMAEGAPARLRSPEDIAAFFDFGDDNTGSEGIVRIPLQSSVAVPFQLLRVRGGTEIDNAFWNMARQRGENTSSIPC